MLTERLALNVRKENILIWEAAKAVVLIAFNARLEQSVTSVKMDIS